MFCFFIWKVYTNVPQGLNCHVSVYMACIYLYVDVCVGLFALFDENCDGQLDLSEMVRAVGWCCRKSGRHDCEPHDVHVHVNAYTCT